MGTIKLRTSAGDSYHEVAKKAKEVARETLTVEFEFNGVINLVTKNTNLDWLWRDYCNAHIMEWKTVGPDCQMEYDLDTKIELYSRELKQAKEQKAQQEEWNKKDDAERKKVEDAIKGTEFLVKPEEVTAYAEYVKINSDGGYSQAVIEYGETWAKIMQKMMTETGKTVAEVADESQKELGYLGITGFQYGCAVSGLSKFWIHGEPLRKWHNKEYGHEGNGVVNPAVLTIGKKD